MRLEHVGPRRGEDVVRQLGLAVDVDRHGGLTGEEAVVDLSGSLGQLPGEEFGLKMYECFETADVVNII